MCGGSQSSGQLLVDVGTAVEGVGRGSRVALLRAAAVQTREHDVADVDDGVRMAAPAVVVRSVGWITVWCLGVESVGQALPCKLGSEKGARRQSMTSHLRREGSCVTAAPLREALWAAQFVPVDSICA